MEESMILFIVGVFVGACVGVVVAALIVGVGRTDEKEM